MTSPVEAAVVVAVLGTAQEPAPANDEGGLRLALTRVSEADHKAGHVPAYHFDLLLDDVRAGTIGLRVGADDALVRYAGQVGYTVEQPFRGQHLAERATRLLFPLARHHRLDPLWITCNPENVASRRTIERLGGALVELVDLPTDSDAYARGERQKLRYRVDLTEGYIPAAT